MKKLISILVTGALVTGLASCSNQYGQGISGAQGGAVVGGVAGGAAGGVAGSQIGGGVGTVVGVIGGALLGAFIGNQIGAYLDQQSQTSANQAARIAFETGRTTHWRTATAYGTIRPGHKYMTSANQVCRSFTTTVTIIATGQTRVVHGTACRNRNMWYCSR